MKKKSKIYVPAWEKIGEAWKTVEAPWRPSFREIKFWEKKLLELEKDNNKIRALVIGSTPEIRELLGKHGIEVVCLDANESMYRAMSKSVKKKNKKEKFMEGSWLKASKILGKNSFDLVMGDCTYCNIAFRDWPLFFKNIFEVLKPKGYFFSAAIISDFSGRIKFKDVLEKYKKDPKFFKSQKNKIWLYYQLIDDKEIYDRKKREFIANNLRNKIKREGTKAGLKPKDLENLWFFRGDLDGELFGNWIEVDPTFKEQLDIQGKFFELEKTYRDPSHPAFMIKKTMILKSKK